MGLAKTKEKLFDVRTVGRYLQKERITPEEYEKYLASLKDVGDQAVVIPTESILGVEGADIGRRKYIPAYKHRKERDFSGITFEDEFDDELDAAEYGIEDDVLSTRNDSDFEE